MTNELLYLIPADKHDKDVVLSLLEKHPEIQYVSLVGIDLAGNDTDEKIPVSTFFNDFEDFFEGKTVQTDGSSVVLTNIATLNNARVDIWADREANWFVDYNFENIDDVTGRPVGTLRIPAFLRHQGRFVDSRAILKETQAKVAADLRALLKEYKVPGLEHINADEIEDIIFTTATELEFWVKTPEKDVELRELSASQKLNEQYWQRTHGDVRTAMERAIQRLEAYGLHPEMGHKEVGGVKATIDETGHLTSVVEQLEIDWKYSSDPLTTADNELLARIVIREVFRESGLEVSYLAKPITGVAGSGEHTHWGMLAKMKDGSVVNLFAPQDETKSFLTVLGIGGIMGLLKNYEAINPFISSTTDSLNRLKPGFEAPVCIVTSFGHRPDEQGRNRTILCGLIRDLGNPMATRFELRSPNPYTNTYTVIALILSAAMDGIRYAVTSGKTEKELEAEISKQAGESSDYLEKDREYRSEKDVFEDYTQEERDRLFGKPPATVWENIKGFLQHPEQMNAIVENGAFSEDLMRSFLAGVENRWKMELIARIVPKNLSRVKAMKRLSSDAENAVDEKRWQVVQGLRMYLAKDTASGLSLFTRLTNAMHEGDYDTASTLQIEMNEKMEELEAAYLEYTKNII